MIKRVLFWGIASFLLVQTIQINIPPIPQIIDTSKEINAPEAIATMLKTSCYDCHSYETSLPWYGNIAPMSWEVKTHIKDGRAWLNFQEWENYNEEKKQKMYRGIVKSINLRMPLPMYISMHTEADLSTAKRKQIKQWAKEQIKKED